MTGRPIAEFEVVIFMRARNLFEWQLQNPQGEIVQSGRAGNVAQARLDGRAAERQNRGK
jgi:hypothetical protein